MSDAMRDCSNERRMLGLAYPRTCRRCGLGPCTSTTSATAPEPTPVDPRDAEIANLRAELSRLSALVAELTAERDEAVNWSGIVDRYGTDQFDALADQWLAMDGIKRVTAAATSTFAKWANDDLMARFQSHQLRMFHMAFVEGCLAGVKASESSVRRLSQLKDTTNADK